MDFPVLGIAFVAFVVARISHQRPRDRGDRDGLGFSQLLHRPGEMIDFARFLVTETPGASVAESMHAFKLRNRPDVGFEAQFEDCTPLQRAVLLQAARDRKLFSKETRDQIARYMGEAQAVAPASVYNALTQLEAKGILAKLEGRGQYQFEDDHLRTWLNEVARH